MTSPYFICAGLDNIANLIKELDGQIRYRLLAELCRFTRETPVLQRLGWMLNRFGRSEQSDLVLEELKNRRVGTVPLEIGNSGDAPVDPVFKVRLNHIPEPDV